MKPEASNEEERLDQALGAWKVHSTLPPRFNQQVWHRIDRQTAQAPAGLLPWLFQWLNQATAHPALATGYVAVLLLTGLSAGYWHARVDTTRASETLGTRYVQMMTSYEDHTR
jgi:hypothetical protein